MKKKKLMLMLPMLHQGGFERVAVATARLLKDDFDITVCIFSDKDIHYDVTGLDIVNLDVPASRGRAKKALNVLRRVNRARRLKRERGIDITYSFGNTANPVNVLSRAGDRVVTGFRCGTDLEDKGIVRLCCGRSDLVLSCSKEIEALLKKDHGCKNTAFVYNPLEGEMIRAQAKEREPDTVRGREAGELRDRVRRTESDNNLALLEEPDTVSDRTLVDYGIGSVRTESDNNVPLLEEVKGQQGTFTIVTMGRDDIIKAHWHLIKAFSIVAESHEEARLKIIGAGRYERARALAKELGIAEKIEFTGALKNPFPDVAAAKLYVLPSNKEGFPNALAEAMALGLPVVATDCRSGPREILLSDMELDGLLERAPYGVSTKSVIDGAWGVLIPDMSHEEDYSLNIGEEERRLAGEIIKLIEDRPRRDDLAGRAIKRAESFSPENYRRELVRVMEALL